MTTPLRDWAVVARVAITFLVMRGVAGNLEPARGAAADTADVVNHRYYSLDSWIGAIGLPDDPFKCVVDADGTFLDRTRHVIRTIRRLSPRSEPVAGENSKLLGGSHGARGPAHVRAACSDFHHPQTPRRCRHRGNTFSRPATRLECRRERRSIEGTRFSSPAASVSAHDRVHQ